MEKIYCWNWKVRTSTYGEFYTLSLKLSELESYVNEKGYVSIVVNKRKQPDNYGNDLAVTINDYKSQEWQKNDFLEQKAVRKHSPVREEEINIEDIPFN